MRQSKVIVLCLLAISAILLLSACGVEKDPTQAETAMQAVYYRVYNGTIDAWGAANFWVPLLWAIFWSVLVAFGMFVGVGMINSRRGGMGCMIGGGVSAVLVFFGTLIYLGWSMSAALPIKADTQGVHVMREGFDMAKFDKANIYVEVIHAPVVGLTPEEKTCNSHVNFRTECPEYEWNHDINSHQVCTKSEDDKGRVTESCHEEHDTEYVPYFKKLVRYPLYVHVLDKLATAESGFTPTPGRENTPHRYLSGWVAPPDYDNWWYQNGWFAARTNLAAYDYIPPVEWQRYYNELYVLKINPLVSFYHRYPNWLFAADAVLYKQFEGNIELYAELGVLPTMKTIYSRLGTGWAADYDFVQFVGGLEVSPEEQLAWQDAAYAYSSFFGNDRQGSLVIVFAPASKVDDVDTYADSIKAYYSQRGKWDMHVDQNEVWQRLMPKNNFILVCKVDEVNHIVPRDGCRLRTGMPHGNEEIIDTFAFRWDREPALQNVQFSPEGFFGAIWSEPTDPDGDGFFEVFLHRLGTMIMDLLLRDDPLGVRRISMKTFDYLQSDIKLDGNDIDKLVAKEVAVQQALASGDLWWAIFWFGGEIGIVLGLTALAFSKRSS